MTYMSTEDIHDTASEANTWDPALTVIEQAKALHADAGFMLSLNISTADHGDACLTAAQARECECEIDPPETLHIEVCVNFGQVFRADGTEDFAARRPMGGRAEALAILRAFPLRVFSLDEGSPKSKARLIELAERAAEVTIGPM
jgi:hypothetical protein